jgi:type VI secretion system protein ImpC
MRDNIGSSADAAYIQNVLTTWLSKYVTTVVNPDDLTLRYYPFKAAAVTVTERPGLIGQYKCEISVSPHIQFEGLDAELRLVTRL